MTVRRTGRLIAAGLILLIWAAWSPARAQEDGAREIIDRVAALYGGAVGFRADYALKATTTSQAGTGGGQETRDTSGWIIFAKPDKLRMLQEKPNEEEIVHSPDGYWWYNSELNEAHRFPLGSVAGVIKPFVSFFSGLKKTGQWFEIKRMPGNDQDGLQALRLVPKSMDMGLNRIDVLVSAKGEIIQVGIHSLIGDSYVYRFSKLQFLTEPPEEGFYFTPPEGAKVIYH